MRTKLIFAFISESSNKILYDDKDKVIIKNHNTIIVMENLIYTSTM